MKRSLNSCADGTPCKRTINPQLKCSCHYGGIVIGLFFHWNDPLAFVDYDIDEYRALETSYNGKIRIEDYAENVQYLGVGCFRDCNIKEVVLPDSLTYIGNLAFFNSSIEQISIGPSVNTICDGAFAYTKNLKTLDLSKSKIKQISGYGHSGYAYGLMPFSSIEYLILPDTFETSYTALQNTTLINFTFKKLMQLKYDSHLLDGRTYTIRDYIYSENVNLMSIKGSIFVKDENSLPTILIKSPLNSSFYFDNNISKVKSGAFYSLKNAKIIFHSENIVFESEAFLYGENLTIVIPNLMQYITSEKEIKNIIITNLTQSQDKWNNPNIENIYYCGESLLNSTIMNNASNINKYTLPNYPHDYFLGTKDFSRTFDKKMCNTHQNSKPDVEPTEAFIKYNRIFVPMLSVVYDSLF